MKKLITIMMMAVGLFIISPTIHTQKAEAGINIYLGGPSIRIGKRRNCFYHRHGGYGRHRHCGSSYHRPRARRHCHVRYRNGRRYRRCHRHR